MLVYNFFIKINTSIFLKNTFKSRKRPKGRFLGLKRLDRETEKEIINIQVFA